MSVDHGDSQAPQHSLRHFLITNIQLALNKPPPILIKLTPSREQTRSLLPVQNSSHQVQLIGSLEEASLLREYLITSSKMLAPNYFRLDAKIISLYGDAGCAFEFGVLGGLRVLSFI